MLYSSKSGPINYQLETAPKPIEPVRYLFDARIEQPITPCKEQPWQGLVSQIDAISIPRSCSNPDHTAGTCDCGRQDSSRTRKAKNNLYTIPIIYG